VLNRLGSWAEVETVFAKGSLAATEAERIELLCDYYYDPDEHPELDPSVASQATSLPPRTHLDCKFR
jgi:hypothetical protein